LQGKLAGKENARLVSISLDPEKDVPEVLRQYADRFKVGPNWLFLTGDKAATYKLAEEGFKLAVADVRNSPEPITHSTKLVLVDGSGWVRGFYDGVGDDQTDKLVGDINRLLAEPESAPAK
jgi:protein SCO1/2